MSQQSVITLNEVSVTYRSGLPVLGKQTVTDALKAISFDVLHGESIGIVGRNGAGKSTLLQLLNGVIQPDAGSITYHDATTSLLSLTVGYDQNVSGRHNAILQGMLMGIEQEEMESSMDDIIAFSELGHYIDVPIKHYSTGMKARLGFSVATRVNADVLLIDEVFAVGDQQFRNKSRQVMHDKITSGDTVVLVTHSVGEVKKLCDRVIWLDRGEIMMSGTPDEVLPRYQESAREMIKTGSLPINQPKI
jgi:lipopolysaccharide transport system ATP-binding protein